MNRYAKLAESLFKAGEGEGSHGGHVIGHTKSGKPIYASSSHPEHANFSPQDHTEAMNHHHEIWSKTQEKIANIKAKRPNWNPPKEITGFLQHHHTQMRMHQNRASRGLARQEAPKTFKVKEGKAAAKHPYNTPQNIHKGLNDIEVPFMAAVVVISPDKKKVLLGKRDKDGKGWESPAGHADIGERPEDVVIRECFEEFNVPLREEQLEHLPIIYKKDMTPIHCFMAITEEDQIKNISCEDDPSQEHTKWKWFELNGELPEAMEDMRFNIVIHAKMALAGVIEMRKSYIPLDDLEGMSQMHTTEFATESEHDRGHQDKIEAMMKDYKPGDAPLVMGLNEDVNMHLVKIDDGLYSGFVKKIDRDGLEETVANIDKMTIPSMVQFLRAKQLLSAPIIPSQSDAERQLKIILDHLASKREIVDIMVYVSMDGDNIGNRVAQAEAENDEQKLMEMSHKIEAGQSVFRTWVQTVGGSIIESGGDEGLAKVPEDALEKVEAFRNQYMLVSGATVTVGVGKTISESTRARELGKLKGKNRVEFFGPASDEELKDLVKPVTEAQKILDSGVLKLMKAVEANDMSEKGKLKRAEESDLITLPKDTEGTNCGNCRFVDLVTNPEKPFCKHVAVNQPVNARMCCKFWDREGSKRAWIKDDVKKSILEIQEKLEQTEDFQKGKALPIGSVRIWQGQHFRKEASGHWVPIAGMGSNAPAQGGPTPDATAAPSKAPSIEEKPKPVKEKRDKHLKHLMPKEGMGGHVTAHSKDVKNALKRGPISIISAGRNNSIAEDRGMTDEQISARTKKLEQDLKDSGLKYMKVKGKYNGGSEDSFLVFHTDPEQMNALGKKYNQDSVIHSKEGKNRLHYTTGENEGKHHKGKGHVMVPEAEDNFSELTSADGKKMKFNLGLDFGKLHEKP